MRGIETKTRRDLGWANKIILRKANATATNATTIELPRTLANSFASPPAELMVADIASWQRMTGRSFFGAGEPDLLFFV